MTAEDLAYEILHIPHTKSSLIGMIEAYARQMIEKDRERVCKSIGRPGLTKIVNEIMNSPINLD